MSPKKLSLLRSALVGLGLLGLSACEEKGAPEAPASEAAESQASGGEGADAPADLGPVIDHQVKTLAGEQVSLGDYRGKALLLVNTASECGYTPQYEGLEELHQRYKDKGLVVIGFPSNDFGGQEPGTPEEIKAFTEQHFGITFPLMAKVHAKGENQAPLYETLSRQTAPGIRGEVKWNFTKFLVDPQGHVIGRFEPKVTPDDPTLVEAIERALPRS